LALALSRFREPSCLRDRSRCLRLSFFSTRRRNRGELILVPSGKTAKCPSPRSMLVAMLMISARLLPLWFPRLVSRP
jgi:hypothetical protein